MTEDEAFEKMTKIKEEGNWCEDYKKSHILADDLLCEFLKSLGFNKLVEEYHKANKWYS